LSGKGSLLRVHQRPRLRFRGGPPLEQISCTAESATFRKARAADLPAREGERYRRRLLTWSPGSPGPRISLETAQL